VATEGKPGVVPLRYVPPEVPDAPPDVVEVLCRRETAILINGHRLKLVEPPFRFYADLLKALIGKGEAGLLNRVMTALRAMATQGSQAEVEAALLSSLIGESADFVCDFLARILRQSNTEDELANALPGGDGDLWSPARLADWLADNVPAAGMAGLVSAALYVCDVATLRGFFGAAVAQFRRRTKA
jgi:hypothetical protein